MNGKGQELCEICQPPFIASDDLLCVLPNIDHCSKYADDLKWDCEKCDDGFIYNKDKRQCLHCDLQKCKECKWVQSNGQEYESCLRCDAGFALTKEYISTPEKPKGDKNLP